ncbi:MAG: NUDIX hydrolase [Nitrososphaera sp.]|uniref:Putative NUDIX hydrolase n=1 Tax=Nitrososphaera gargensis (strain Ga9.2) TaxID=1237085 RepID=K0ILM5_NITGG|nr:NUDIX hydrolase [Candidatus Nitrososphaera gargensis]AFU59567.1 putative NUDIX hydrolase [Candidatus Nitrososphaera gargensis Ga9.2]
MGRGSVRAIRSSTIYSGGINLRRDRFMLGGKVIDKEIVEHKDSVGIVAISGSDDVILVTQYRRAADRVLLEIPAGKMEKGETPRQAAIREMAEEIGYSGKLEPLTRWYLAPGYSTELMHVFVATNLRKIVRGPLDDDENIKIKKVKLSAAVKKCLSGEIQDSKTVAALLVYSQSD